MFLWFILIILALFLFSELMFVANNAKNKNSDKIINIYIVNKKDIHNHKHTDNSLFLTSTQAEDFSNQLKENATKTKHKELDYHKKLSLIKKSNQQLEIKVENIYDSDTKRSSKKQL